MNKVSTFTKSKRMNSMKIPQTIEKVGKILLIILKQNYDYNSIRILQIPSLLPLSNFPNYLHFS